MEDIENFILKYKCLEKCVNRVCSRCHLSGFKSTPAFYRYNETLDIYLCDNCHETSYKGGWIDSKLQNVEKVSGKIIKIVRERGLY